ncbi:hypothetical protein ABW21_db0208355 [Orbilia brochopaga]|nr:hypothetical protein ABW21_db0208355 [Drechslerella brochopaga]
MSNAAWRQKNWENYVQGGRSLVKEQAAREACLRNDLESTGDPEMDLIAAIGWEQLKKELDLEDSDNEEAAVEERKTKKEEGSKPPETSA